MASVQALDDADRKPWLESLGRFLADQDAGAIVVCSALKRSHRDFIDTIFVGLHGSYELLKERMSQRSGHFMPVVLLDSQFETLEELQPGKRASCWMSASPQRNLPPRRPNTYGVSWRFPA